MHGERTLSTGKTSGPGSSECGNRTSFGGPPHIIVMPVPSSRYLISMVVERRQRTRKRTRGPAYASMGEGPRGLILDASNHGLALKTDLPISVGTRGEIKLELLETDRYITTAARVAWSDDEGHAGIEFLGLSSESSSQLEDWLRLESQPERHWTVTTYLPKPAHQETTNPSDADAQLASLAEQAILLTRAHGAAIALNDGSCMRCRGAAGEIAPPIALEIDTKSGLTGACLRSGRVLRCDDADRHPLVDRESCRTLGVRSIIAAPILYQGSVVGLIEVFSRHSCAFDDVDCHSLERLAIKLLDSLAGSALRSDGALNGAQHLIVSAPTRPENATYPLLIPPGYEFSWVEKLMLHKQAALLPLAAILLAAGAWLGFGAPRPFRNSAAPQAATNLRPGEQALSTKSSDFDNTRPSTTHTPHPWLEEVRKRAEGGDLDAELKLGAAYADGREIQQNYGEAVKWLTRATNHGNATAAAELGAFYWEGRGVTQDYVEAYVWSAIAQAEGDEASGYRLAILQSRMSPIELAEAKQRAAVWLRTHRGKQIDTKSTK